MIHLPTGQDARDSRQSSLKQLHLLNLLLHLQSYLFLRANELCLLLHVFRDLVENNSLRRLSAHRQLVQALVELVQIPGLVELNVRLGTLIDQVFELLERIVAKFYLWGVGQVEGLLVSIQVDELDAACSAAHFDQKWPRAVLG